MATFMKATQVAVSSGTRYGVSNRCRALWLTTLLALGQLAQAMNGAPNPSNDGSYTVYWSSPTGHFEEPAIDPWIPYSIYDVSLVEQINGGSATTVVTSQGNTSKAFSGKANGSYSYSIVSTGVTYYLGQPYPFSTVVESIDTPVTVAIVPATPGGLSHNGGDPNYSGSYTVSWSGVGGASSYELQERVNGGGWVTVHSDGAISWNASGKSAVNTYGYQVRACAGAGCSGYSGTVDVVVNVPGVPGGLGHNGGDPNYSGSYTVSWSGVGGASSYQLEEQQNGGAWVVFSPTSNTNFGISGRPLGTHHYAVRACGGTGQCSAFSSPITVTVVSLASTYEYDALGRVVRVTYNDGSGVTYSYDAAGNRVVVTATKL